MAGLAAHRLAVLRADLADSERTSWATAQSASAGMLLNADGGLGVRAGERQRTECVVFVQSSLVKKKRM